MLNETEILQMLDISHNGVSLTIRGMSGYYGTYVNLSVLMEVAVCVTIVTIPFIYVIFVFFTKRREHHTKHVRTGSLKSTNAAQTSPNASRKVSI